MTPPAEAAVYCPPKFSTLFSMSRKNFIVTRFRWRESITVAGSLEGSSR
jgi:hypothetical protein